MKRIAVWLTLFVLLSALLMGCASRPTGGETAARAPEGSTFVDLPALVMEFDANGEPQIFDMPLSLLPGLDTVSLEPEMVARFTQGDVQYVQVDVHPHGLAVLANGKPILGLRYNDEELQSALNALNVLIDPEKNASTLSLLAAAIPLLDNMGMGIIARFPMQDGKTPVAAATQRSYDVLDDQEFADAQKAVQRVTALPLNVAADGTLSSTNFMFAMIGGLIPPLPMDTITDLGEKGITEISVQTRPYGLVIGLNGNALPLMTMNNNELDNLLNFADQADLWSQYAPGLSPDILGILRGTVLPFLLGSNFDIVMTFPESVGS